MLLRERLCVRNEIGWPGVPSYATISFIVIVILVAPANENKAQHQCGNRSEHDADHAGAGACEVVGNLAGNTLCLLADAVTLAVIASIVDYPTARRIGMPMSLGTRLGFSITIVIVVIDRMIFAYNDDFRWSGLDSGRLIATALFSRSKNNALSYLTAVGIGIRQGRNTGT